MGNGGNQGSGGATGTTTLNLLDEGTEKEKTFWGSMPNVDGKDVDRSSKAPFFIGGSKIAGKFPAYVLNPNGRNLPYGNQYIEGEEKGNSKVTYYDSPDTAEDTLHLVATNFSTPQALGNLITESENRVDRSGYYYQNIRQSYRQHIGEGGLRRNIDGPYHMYVGGDHIVEIGGNVISLIGGDTYTDSKQRNFNWGDTEDYNYSDGYSERWGNDTDHHYGIASSFHNGMANSWFLGMQNSFSFGPTFELSAAGGISIDLGALKFTLEASVLTATVIHSPLTIEYDSGLKTEKNTVQLKEDLVKIRKATVNAGKSAIRTMSDGLRFIRPQMSMASGFFMYS